DVICENWPRLRRRRGAVLIRMDGIGDMVLFRRTLDDYAGALGMDRSEITVIGCASWGAIAPVLFDGFKLFVVDEHAYARQPFYRFKIGLRLRRLAPKVALCDSYFRRVLMADSLVAVSGAERKIVSLPYINEPTRTEFTYYLSRVDQVIETGDYPTHEIIRHYRFLSALAGREIQPQPPKLQWRDAALPASLPAGAPYVVLNPGSNEPGRRWPFDKFLNLAKRLIEAGYRVVLLGGEGERPGDHRQRFGQGPSAIIDLIGRTSLSELMDIMAHAACVISNDTGPAHIGIGLGAPTVVIVGGGHFGSFVPYSADVAPPNARFVFHEMPCYHCFWRCDKRPSKFDVFPCIDEVGEEKVWSALEDLLPQSAGA
ncbi:MAG: glycosyltransferase family 9 protein, partial [Rhodospirillales bacterium]|nr:glycosyltransferase family 9 protein [Rhodospirillales bacterium]